MNIAGSVAAIASRRSAADSGIADWDDEPIAVQADHAPLVDLRRTWSAVRRSRYVIAAILAVTLAIGVASILLTPPTYRARASVQIDQQTTRILGTEDNDPSIGAASDAERFLQTQVDILRSRALAIRVVEALDLAASDSFATAMGVKPDVDISTSARRVTAIALLQSNLRVDLPRNSRVVPIDVTSRDPALAARIANSYAEQFIASNIQRKFSTSAYSREFLQAQLAQTKMRLEQSERALIDYARGAQLIDASAGSGATAGAGPRSLTTANLVELNAAFAEARSNRVRAHQRWQQAQASPLFSQTEVLSNATIQQLTQQRAALQAQYQQLRQRLKIDHPSIQQLGAQIGELDGQINTLALNVRRSVREQYLLAQRQEAALDRSVGSLKTATLAEQDRSVRYNILRREADTNRQLYDGLLQRFKEVSAEAGVTNNNISIVDVAEAPTIPVSPRPVLNLALAALAGLVLAAAFVIARDRLDDVVRLPDDLEMKLGIPLLGVGPLLPGGQAPAEALDDPKSALSEAHHAIRVALELSSAGGLPRTMLVTSSRPSEGKSTTSWAIARDIAQSGRRTLLIDADLRKPSLHRLVGMSNSFGLSNLLAGHDDLDAAVKATTTGHLSLLPSGPLPPNPAQLLSGPGLRRLLETLSGRFDTILIDGPPVLTLADAPSLGAVVDGTVFVVEADGAHRGSAKVAIKRLRSAGVTLLGGVMTKFDPRAAGYGAETYYYNYRYYGEDRSTATA